MRSLLAAIMMFTRLPLWRIVNVDKRYFTDVIKYWPLVGFLTGTATGGVLWVAAQVVPLEVACILAIIARVLLTGALHEDGLADFFDGFGGGTSKDKILAIMKDSHIGWTSEEYLSFLRQNGWRVRKSAVLKASFPLTYAECVKSEV